MAEEHILEPSDYSCYITIHNKTGVDLSLFDQHASSGKWPKENPPNTIEANAKQTITLKDKFGFAGSEGWVAYQLYLPKNPDFKITLKIEFGDPYSPSYDNYCKASTPTPTLINPNVLEYSSNGHPFYAHVEVVALGGVNFNTDDGASFIAQELEKQARTSELATRPAGKCHANFDIGYVFEPFTNKRPVHESITVAALIASHVHLAPGANYNNLHKDQWEWLRGIIWNDDSSCLLFDDSDESNHLPSKPGGAEWYARFLTKDQHYLMCRSHFGELQFLHGMAAIKGEDAQATKGRLLAWMEIMYKLACGNQGVSANNTLNEKLPWAFQGSVDPTGDVSLKDLLIGQPRQYKWPKIERRALGVCLHMIQDSYAVGHTLRRLTNPGDMNGKDDSGFVRFKPNTYAKLGPIITFHTYDGQDSNRHRHYDEYNGDVEELVPKKPETFNSIIGARDAIEMSRQLINFWHAKTKWDDGVKKFLEEAVLKLDDKHTKSNTEIDEHLGEAAVACRIADVQISGGEWQAGMERKWASLEAGLAHSQLVVPECHRISLPLWFKRYRRSLTLLMGCSLGITGFFTMFAISSYVLKLLGWA